jgi:hypothetical protein
MSRLYPTPFLVHFTGRTNSLPLNWPTTQDSPDSIFPVSGYFRHAKNAAISAKMGPFDECQFPEVAAT